MISKGVLVLFQSKLVFGLGLMFYFCQRLPDRSPAGWNMIRSTRGFPAQIVGNEFAALVHAHRWVTHSDTQGFCPAIKTVPAKPGPAALFQDDGDCGPPANWPAVWIT